MWKLPALAEPTTTTRLLLAFDYPFTHHRVRLRIHPSRAIGKLSPLQQWLPLTAIDTIPLAAPHRRAIKRLAAEHALNDSFRDNGSKITVNYE